MRKLFFIAAASLAASVFGFTPTAYTNSYTEGGVTYVQRGALGTKDYVVTNVTMPTIVFQVTSVNSKTGAVVLVADDVTALPSDSVTALTNNSNFKAAVEAVSPPVSTNGLASVSYVDTATNATYVSATNSAQNVIREDVRTNFLCTVSAAQAMTNGLDSSTFVPWMTDSDGNKTAVTIGTRGDGIVGVCTLAQGNNCVAEGYYTHAEGGYTHAEGDSTHAEGYYTHAEDGYTHAEGYYTHASTLAAHAEGIKSEATNRTAYVWNGTDTGEDSYIDIDLVPSYGSHGSGTYNINPVSGLAGFWVGDTNLSDHIDTRVTAATNAVASSIATTSTNAAEAVVAPIVATVSSVSNRQDSLEGYIAGQRVRVSVTNYYGSTSGQLPRLRIEEFVTTTNVTAGVSTETNYWQLVWDEQSKYDRFLTDATAAIAAMTNNLYQTYYALLMERMNTKAPRAWGTLTSAGEAAPAGSVWHTEPNTVFAGGTEYARAMVGSGVIGVLTTKGAAVYTDGDTGRFHFTTDDKQHYFGMNIASRYELGCATDGITVTPVGGNQMVDLLYNVTMTGKPILYYTPTLSGNITWEQITDSSGSAIPGATVYASWDTQPPAGSEICTVNCGQGISGFFKAAVEYAATSKFETNMPADFGAGILATNQTLNLVQPIEPYISNGSVLWRIKQ